MTAGNATNATLVAEELAEAELLALCEVHRHTPYVYLGVSPVWLIFLCEWLWAICWRHVDVAVDLHRLLLWVPIIELLHCVLSIFHFWLCPWRSTIEQIVGAGWIILTILKEPVMLVCLLLVAKGWGITRPRLGLGELSISSIVVVLLYSSIVVQFASTHWAAVIPMLVMWSAMLVNVIASILANLRVLKAQLLALRTFNVDATTTPAFTKYRMFVTLLVCTVLYYVMDITIFIFASLKLVPPWASALARQLLEIITAALIGHAFRARPLNAMFEQVQQIAMDLAQDLLPQISTVTVDVAALRGDGTVPWSRAIDLQAAKRTGQLSPVLTPPEMLLVLNPADTELLSASASGEKAAVQPAFTPAAVPKRADVRMESLTELKTVATKLNPAVGYWDPLKLAEAEFWDNTNEETIGFLRHAEIKHGRIAMAGFVGYCAQANGVKFPWEPFASITTTSPPEQWDALAEEAKIQIILGIGFLEWWSELRLEPGAKHYMKGGKPGYIPNFDSTPDQLPHWIGLNLWDPFKLTKDLTPAQKENKLLAEVNNGRLAMLGLFGLLCEGKIPGSVPLLKGVIPFYAGEPMAPLAYTGPTFAEVHGGLF